MKKILALLLAVVLLLALGAPAFAAAGDVTLTIQGKKSGHTYEAYQLFSGTVAQGTLTEVNWGTGVDGTGLLAALQAENTTEVAHPTHEGEKTTLAAQFKDAKTANDVAEVIKTWGNDSELLDLFAEVAGEHLTGVYAPSKAEAGNKYSFTLQPGYYLIKDKVSSGDPLVGDFYTKFLILLTDKTDAEVKGDVPTVTKKVSHNLSNNFGPSITNQLQKTHYYELVGTMPSDLEDYDSYFYEFNDTLSVGLDFIRFEQIYIQHTGDVKTLIYDASQTNPLVNEALKPTVYENIDKTVHVKWDDLLKVYPTLLSSDKVVIKYSAKLNASAVVGKEGNPNEVTLKYSNSPSADGYGITLPADPVVYTFALEVLKQDEVSKKALKDAEFVLYHIHTVNGTDAEGKPTTENVPVYAVLKDGKVDSWTETLSEATVLKTDDKGKLTVTGIQANLEYYLKETKAPVGYNKLTKDVKVMITKVGYSGASVSSIEYTVDGVSKTLSDGNAFAGTIPVTVNNRAGATLPSTGGVGTTMFYVIGGLMVAAAVVLLVTKKRMSASN